MFLEAFTDELVSTELHKMAFLRSKKVPDRLLQRLVAAGALSSASLHGAKALKAGVLGEPMPNDSFAGAATRGAVGGLLATLALKGLGRLSGLGRAAR